MQLRETALAIDDQRQVTALTLTPDQPKAVYVFAHGAGAGPRHSFMEAMADRLAHRDIATVRFFFPYMQSGTRRPDSPALLKQTIAAAFLHARGEFPDLALFAGGKSMGGRVSSALIADGATTSVDGLIFVGFPLHPPGKESRERADHLVKIELPMLFLQGSRDRLADLGLMREVMAGLGDRAEMQVIEGADHGFQVLKRSGRTDDSVLDELAATVSAWIERL